MRHNPIGEWLSRLLAPDRLPPWGWMLAFVITVIIGFGLWWPMARRYWRGESLKNSFNEDVGPDNPLYGFLGLQVARPMGLLFIFACVAALFVIILAGMALGLVN